MPTTYKILGQSSPAASTWATAYTCPSSTQTIISTISICNTGIEEAQIRIALRPNGATLATSQYLVYDVVVLPTDTIAITIGATIDAADLIDVRSNKANVAFNIFGSEIT